MPGIIDHASAILSASERRLQAAAINLANISTPGFKRQVTFSTALENCGSAAGCTDGTVLRSDFKQGPLSATGEPLDLAINGPALFQLRDGDTAVLSRGGSFVRGEGGTLTDPMGRILQQAGGGDLSISGERIEILDDGTVLEDGLPTARIALVEMASNATGRNELTPAGGTIFTAGENTLKEAESSSVRQGFIEKSNVVTSDEMISMMASVRQAESGGRLAQFYDRLMGQAITTFSRNSR